MGTGALRERRLDIEDMRVLNLHVFLYYRKHVANGYKLFFPVENAHAADHPGCAHVGGDKIQCFFQISDVVDLGNAFLFQLFHKGIHVAVEAFLGEEILERKSSAAFYDAQ